MRREPIDEALEDAVERDFGAQERTTELAPGPTGRWLGPGLMLTALGGVLFAGAWGPGGFLRSGPMAGQITLTALFAVVLALGLVTLATAVRTRRLGSLFLHLYERGFIVERINGSALSATLASTDAELIDFAESDEHRVTGHRVGLRLVLSSGAAWAVDMPVGGPAEALVELAERCRSVRRRTLSYNRAVLLISKDDII